MKLTRRILLRLGPDLVALIFFTFVWIVLMFVYGQKIHFVEGSTVLPSIILCSLMVFATASHLRQKWNHRDNSAERIFFHQRIRRMLRDWIPLIALLAVYETLRDYVGVIHPQTIDRYLYELDLKIFGVEPTVWIQKFLHPFWTDYFAFMYVLYFFLPMVIATLLYVSNRRRDFRELALGCVICMYGGYIMYLLFPAGPPRFFNGIVFEPKNLQGLFGFYEFTQGKMDASMHVIHNSSFPSLHCALSMLAFLHAFRFGNVWKRSALIAFNGWIAISIWVATVYLRHHWVVDILAGWLLAWASFYLAKKLRIYWDYIESIHHHSNTDA